MFAAVVALLGVVSRRFDDKAIVVAVDAKLHVQGKVML